MRNFTKTLACLLFATGLMFGTVNAQIFSQDFNSTATGFTGWAIVDGDGQTPHPNVAQFTAAWILAADFDNTTDTVAMSTSWYSPLTGPSDDWMITPQIALTSNNALNWEGEAQDANFPDGYEVRLSTTTQTPTSAHSNTLFTIAAETGAVWTQRSVNLQTAGFANQNVYISWRNNSFDQFVLMIDDVSVDVALNDDVALSNANPSEYTIIPIAQAASVPISGEITNMGGNTANNVTMKVNVYDGGMSQVYTQTSASQNINAAASANFTVPAFSPSAPDVYTFELVAQLTGDQNASNDTMMWQLLVSDSTFARDNGQVAGALGIGAGNGGIIGQIYELNTAADLTSISVFHTPDIGQQYYLEVYSFNNGTPQTVVARTDTFISTIDTAIFMTFPISGGGVSLPADTFFVGMREPDSTLAVGYTQQIFTLETTFIDWPTITTPWSNNEDFGFNVSYVMRANFNSCAGLALQDSAASASCGQNDGAAIVIPGAGVAPYSYNWSNGGTTQQISNVGAGVYMVTVTDANGCTDSASVSVNNIGGPTLQSATGTNVTCNGDGDGTATASATGGTPPYSYMWSNGGTTQSISNLGGGTYTVTITDANGCLVSGTVTVTEPAALAAGASATDETCQGCNDGTATASPTGGTAPYTYNWSNGSTSQNIFSLAPGTYTVTITDANGCTTMQDVTVGMFVGVNVGQSLQVDIYPNPSNGNFTINVESPTTNDITVELYGDLGQLVFSETRMNTSVFNKQFTLNDVAAGRYMVKIKHGDHFTVRKLVIK